MSARHERETDSPGGVQPVRIRVRERRGVPTPERESERGTGATGDAGANGKTTSRAEGSPSTPPRSDGHARGHDIRGNHAIGSAPRRICAVRRVPGALVRSDRPGSPGCHHRKAPSIFAGGFQDGLERHQVFAHLCCKAKVVLCRGVHAAAVRWVFSDGRGEHGCVGRRASGDGVASSRRPGRCRARKRRYWDRRGWQRWQRWQRWRRRSTGGKR